MRDIDVSLITSTIKDLCIKANMVLPCDLNKLIENSVETEKFGLAKQVLGDIKENIVCAKDLGVPICQDTGMAVIFMEVGQDVHFVGGNINEAVNEGVRRGYIDGKLRASIVTDPIKRVNSNDNTPCVLHLSYTDGDKVNIMVAPKGFGSENMSAMKMFTPSATVDDIIAFVVNQVNTAGSNPCPPIVVGVGIGGDFEKCAFLAKKALCRNVSKRHEDEFYANIEQRMLDGINALGIGPQGFGGTTTALAVNIETFGTHIAGLPVSVNIGCHVTRHASAEI